METQLETYTYPADGHDWCHGCSYLEQVHTTMLLADDNVMVPLCFDCAMKIGEN